MSDKVITVPLFPLTQQITKRVGKTRDFGPQWVITIR